MASHRESETVRNYPVELEQRQILAVKPSFLGGAKKLVVAVHIATSDSQRVSGPAGQAFGESDGVLAGELVLEHEGRIVVTSRLFASFPEDPRLNGLADGDENMALPLNDHDRQNGHNRQLWRKFGESDLSRCKQSPNESLDHCFLLPGHSRFTSAPIAGSLDRRNNSSAMCRGETSPYTTCTAFLGRSPSLKRSQ